MTRDGSRTMMAGAMLGWVGVVVYGVWEIVGEEAGDGWERPYLLFSLSLLLAVALTIAVTWGATRTSRRQAWRKVGLGVGAIAVVSSLVAWALPLWATLLAISCAASAVGAPRGVRHALTTLTAAQLVGMAVMFGAIEAKVGTQDGYGDYPAAFGLGTVVLAAGSVLGLAMLARAVGSTQSKPTMTLSREAPATV